MISYDTIVTSQFGQNCRIFVNDETKEALIVDPGDSAAKLANLLEQSELQLKTILITHMHLDHIGGVARLANLTGAKIQGSSIMDDYLLKSIDVQAKNFGLPYSDSFEPEYLKDGQLIEPITGLSFKVFTTPGHTKGSVCYYDEELAFVITGDTLFLGSVGRTDLQGGSFDDLIKSINEKLFTLPDDTIVMPGHGPNTSIGYEKANNPFLK